MVARVANNDVKASPQNLFCLGYVSTETKAHNDEDLVALLEKARERNGKQSISGLLLYRQGSFYQVLEGPEEAVRRTFQMIQQDPNHKEVRVLFKTNTDAREFADWRMGFLNLDGVDVSKLTGFSDFLRRDAEPQAFLENLSRGKRLALMFRTML